MNRIYQGRVSAVERTKAGTKGEWEPLSDWQVALWQHHELFQDAVNYYTLALAALAEGVSVETARGKAVTAWREKVREQWRTTTRKARNYPGPHARVAALLGLDAATTDFEACAARLLSGSRANVPQRTAALLQLLDEAASADLSQLSVSRLPFFCTGRGKFDGTSKAVVSQQETERQKLVRHFRDLPDNEALELAPKLNLGLFLTQPPKEELMGDDAAKALLAYWKKAVKNTPSLLPLEASFNARITIASAALRIPAPGRKPSGLYPLAATFRFLPCAETLAMFRDATRALCDTKDKLAVADSLAEARVGDAPLFDYFTNLAFHREADAEQRAAWFEFDLAAFLEAIKAPHRYFQDTQTREAAADRLRSRLTMMNGEGGKDEEGDAIAGFAGDERIAQLRSLVTDANDGLAYLAEADSGPGGAIEYTIQERTLRGWNVIRDKWRALAEAGLVTKEALWRIVSTEQAGHHDDFGSATLYAKLAEAQFQGIWRDSGKSPWHADDPLRAWLDYTELRFELADKTRPIRFTPADATHSPRFFIFPKRNGGGRWGSEHKTDSLAFTAGFALRDGQKFRPVMARFAYSAPRLLRDELRRDGDSVLETAPWLQPMMQAIGLAEPPVQDFGNCRITLQPTSRDNHQLTFPVEIASERIIAQFGKQTRWARQFNVAPDGDDFRNASLRWPHEKGPAKPLVAWHDALDGFSALAVDLGQRDAGAFALLEARANHDFGRNRQDRPVPARFIGETPGKRWHAALRASGLLQLPGENREEWRARSEKDDDDNSGFAFREELHGSRGRSPRPAEIAEFATLLVAFLGQADATRFLPEAERARLSFPEQNDKLIVAARRAQSRVARLHRWCWFLADDKKRPDAEKEIREALALPAEERWLPEMLTPLSEKDADPRLATGLATTLHISLEALPGLLARLANRILPLRGRSWQWVPHPQATMTNRLGFLAQTGPALPDVWLRGQRGLAMTRIEQIEELRRRFQSLNQTLRRDIGGKPPIRRDETVPDPCPDLLDKLDELKRQRVNQTAHLILAEALGVRLAAPRADKAARRQDRDQHGVYERFRSPADFIVVEDLSRYRTTQGRSPRENGRLMKWCHRAVRDKLLELCEPFGLPVLETPAAYSSRFCSRSGVAGFRAVEVTAGFENHAPWSWFAAKLDERGKPTEEAALLTRTARVLHDAQSELHARWSKEHPGQPAPKRTLLLPQSGGPIFIPAVGDLSSGSIQPAVVQADVNAAIALALRAIADTRLWDIHPRLRTERLGGEPGKKRSKAQPTEAASSGVPRLRAREKRKYGENGPELKLGELSKTSAVTDTRQPNYFRDLAEIADWDTAHIPNPCDAAQSVPLVSGKALWGAVKKLQWERCRKINDARFADWQEKALG